MNIYEDLNDDGQLVRITLVENERNETVTVMNESWLRDTTLKDTDADGNERTQFFPAAGGEEDASQ